MGTETHALIETFYVTGEIVPQEWRAKELAQFLKFRLDRPEIQPYASELVLYDEELRIGGSVDFISRNPDGSLDIYEWKRSSHALRRPSCERPHSPGIKLLGRL